MGKRYNTPHRSRVVKTRMTEEEYADFPERLKN
ncbi:MAG: mobilization protein, partial [Clostridium sp.]